MGLDMYLSKRTYIREADRKESRELLKILVKIFCPDNKLNINPERITYIEEKVGYWRKANQIHKWFVDNIQAGKDDCGYYPVTSENLEFQRQRGVVLSLQGARQARPQRVRRNS